MTETHTPTPWLAKEDGYEIYITSPDYDDNGYEIAIVDNLGLDGKQADLQRVNAAFIVRAANAHDELVEALEEARDYVRSAALDPANSVAGKRLALLDTALAKATQP
jgi:hypothetical protein